MKENRGGSYYETSKHRIEKNLSENGVMISDSKSRLIYRDFIKNDRYFGFFTTSLSIFLSFLIAIFTSNFKDFFKIENTSDIIFAFFVFVCISSGILTIIFFILYLKNRKKCNEEAFINALHDKEKY